MGEPDLSLIKKNKFSFFFVFPSLKIVSEKKYQVIDSSFTPTPNAFPALII
jgi:hypothetical protein